MPDIPRKEYLRRRRNLMSQMEPNSIAILPSASLVIRNRDAEYRFRQDSDFYYLTGFKEPGAVLVLIPGRRHGECVFFCRERDPERELWDGFREGPEGVVDNYGADDAFPIVDIDDILPGLLEGRERVYYAMGRRTEFDRQVMDWINVLRSNSRAGAHPPGEFLDLDHLLHDMRLYKSAAELRVMRAAAQISAEAHMRAMQHCEPGMMEYQLEAEYQYVFGKCGAPQAAYSSIVGAGANACVLHYVENDAVIRNGDLVLVDAGCELNCYASDITRTFPANGQFSKPQQALYEVVLEAQQQAIAKSVSGRHWNDPHDVTVQVITQGLLDLGLLKGELKELIETEAYREFYMHRAGHWLGIDVHDVGDYKVHDEWRVLEPGMVLTVEPGIYVAPSNTRVAAKWRGIGIRIEDDVAVTKTGNEILSKDACKSVEDIHRWMDAGSAMTSLPVPAGAKRGSKQKSRAKKTTAKKPAKKPTKANKKKSTTPKAAIAAKATAKIKKASAKARQASKAKRRKAVTAGAKKPARKR
ncbi:MAG: Xaa-Pro aminopeptidase [Gammaproteobacteria bacterium]|nr:Xaa-Pro aminopeptidase [Gammaproteobacteria bacterium]MBT8149858.1 Xaa-Pro aminopeptidase [Gammaproteobacteria bacterium]